jgi:hypothetical protein
MSPPNDLDHTLAAMVAHAWTLVLCRPRSKAPSADPDGHWLTTMESDEVSAHVAAGGNLGLCAGTHSRLALLDPDHPAEWARLVRALGTPGKAWVRTGSGKEHVYVAWEPSLPAKILSPDGEIVGEVQRGGADGGGHQHCLIPPSVHPDTGHRYIWLVDPATEPLLRLPEAWRAWFGRPRTRACRRNSQHASVASHSDLEARAMAQPGAVRRASGLIKFACPACRGEGFDGPGDNAALFPDGKWGCAWAKGTALARKHWDMIGRALGAFERAR